MKSSISVIVSSLYCFIDFLKIKTLARHIPYTNTKAMQLFCPVQIHPKLNKAYSYMMFLTYIQKYVSLLRGGCL